MKGDSWRIAAASAAGAAHIGQNTACQDRFAWRCFETGSGEVLVAVVADGAGSTACGERGAETACRLFVEQAQRFLEAAGGSIGSLNHAFGRRWLGFFHQTIEEEARNEGREPREFASTLVAAVAGPGGAAYFQVGDGGAVASVSGSPGSYVFAVEPFESEYVNVTDFITDEDAGEKLRFRFSEEAPEDLILFTDGISQVAVDYRTNSPHEPFLMPMIAPLRSGADGLDAKLAAYLSSPGINEKSDDDKTMILATRRAVVGY